MTNMTAMTPTQDKLTRGEYTRDAAEAIGRELCGTIKGVNLAERTCDGVVSTINLDRDGEIILPSAFTDDLPRFLASNAAFLAVHLHRSDDGSPTQIGWVDSGRVEAPRVVCVFRFAAIPVAEQWWQLASDPKGKGIAFSIGFCPTRWVHGSVVDIVHEFPQLKRILADAGMQDDDHLRVYTKIELLEISAVPVPSNRESLQLLAAKYAGELTDSVVTGLAADGKPTKLIEQFTPAIVTAVGKAVSEAVAPITDILAMLADQVADMHETIELSSDTLGQEPPPPTPQAAEESSGPADDGAGARDAEKLRKAAARLKAASGR